MEKLTLQIIKLISIPETLCIIPCGSRKIWDKYPGADPTPAKLVYTGSFSLKCREYAEKFYPGTWCILSAKHGFLFPNDVVEETYNISFNDMKSNPISIEELSRQVKAKRLNDYQDVIIVRGRNYVKMATMVFETQRNHIPLAGCRGLGYMMKKLNEAIIAGLTITNVAG